MTPRGKVSCGLVFCLSLVHCRPCAFTTTITLVQCTFSISPRHCSIVHDYFFCCFAGMRTGMNVKVGLTDAIMKKIFRMTRQTRLHRNSGNVINLISTDAAHLDESIPYFHSLWSSPFQVIVAMYFLYQQLGWSIVAGKSLKLMMAKPRCCA